MGEWHKVEPRPYSPCDSCQVGFCSISQKTVDGVLYEKSEDCHETCEILKKYHEKPERFFGENIRDAIRILRR